MTPTLLIAAALASTAACFAQDPATRTIPLAQFRDKIEGGWAGQMIGVSFGARTEFRAQGVILDGDLPAWTPERVSNSLNQDDLYVEMTFAKVLDEKGPGATTEDFGAALRDARYSLWHATLAARRALKRGVPAAETGLPRNNAHANDIDFQIEADFAGLMAPGLPRASNELCYRVGRLINHGDGIYGGMFVAAMYSAAFFESDPERIVRAALAVLPAASPYARIISDVLAWHERHPGDWKAAWRLIEENWHKREPCPGGALRPFNIDAKINGAYVALGLLYGGGDFSRTIEITTRAGQDSDCNPASAAGVLGVVLGYKRIPEEWKGGIPAIAERKFNYTDYSFRTMVESTERRAIALVKANGGRVEGAGLVVKTQTPSPARLALWDDYGFPVERIAAADERWTWKGAWASRVFNKKGKVQLRTRISAEKGAEAAVSFEGTGAIVVGPYLGAGGKAEIYLDGKLDRIVDVYSDEEGRNKLEESVWHAFKLPRGRHTIRVVVRGEPYPGAQGAEIGIDDLIVFQ